MKPKSRAWIKSKLPVCEAISDLQSKNKMEWRGAALLYISVNVNMLEVHPLYWHLL